MTIRIKDAKQAEAFIAALEASEKDQAEELHVEIKHAVNTDHELSRHLAELRKKRREEAARILASDLQRAEERAGREGCDSDDFDCEMEIITTKES